MKYLTQLLPALISIAFIASCALDGETLTDEDLDNYSTSTDAITDGTPDLADKNVVLVFHQTEATGRGFACTGTLIRARTVLTAAHCVPDAFIARAVFFGFDIANNPTMIRIIDHRIYPGYDGGGKGHDLALLELESPGPVAPAQLNASFTRLWDPGTPVRMVGFGDRDPGPTVVLGQRYQGDGVLALRQSNNNVVIGKAPSAVLPGDSGGPTFAACGSAQCVVGVHSVVYLDGQGQPVYSGDTAVDPYYAWIISTAAILEAF